jgi:hypothetical protein
MYFNIAGGVEGICFAVGATKFRCMSPRLELLWENSYGRSASLSESAVLSSDTGLAVHNDLRGSSTVRGLNLQTGVTDWTLDCDDYAVAGLNCQNGDDLGVSKRLALSADELYVYFNPKNNWLFKSNVKLAPTLAPATLAPALPPVLPPSTLAPALAPPTLAPVVPPTLAPAAVPVSESPSSSPTSSATVISVVGSIACVVIGLSMLM